jgi:HAD superfamily hydrolase (TIGR01509 family)
VSKNEHYLLRTEGHEVIPYIIDLMKDLHQNGMKLIIASSSPSEAIQEVLETLYIQEYFDGYVSGMMVENSKPAPDIFLLAAKHLSVEPSECIVIEDSYHGITAAVAANITSIGFINPNSGKQDLSKADMLVEGFDEVDYEFVNRVYQYSHLEPITILSTEHCVLRELSPMDIDGLCNICSKQGIKEYLDDFSTDVPLEKEKHIAYIKSIYHYYGFGLWGVFLKNTNTLIGRCGVELKMLNQDEIYELGYLLDTNYQGHGYAIEFVTATIKYCFEHLEIPRIVAIIDISNNRSLKLAGQVGMHNTGECIRNNRHCNIYEINNKS